MTKDKLHEKESQIKNELIAVSNEIRVQSKEHCSSLNDAIPTLKNSFLVEIESQYGRVTIIITTSPGSMLDSILAPR
ncbi:MAG: hypothetical protein GY799_16620 [Desulfobulbaceae bacterium]|nr:hypothetical protein [Desulfobulbaceae bacterium]